MGNNEPSSEKKSRTQRFFRFMEVYDWIWAVPISTFTYWFFGFFFGAICGMSIGNFDLSFVQPLFLAVTVVIGASTASIYVLRFHFKSIFKFIYTGRNAHPTLNSVDAFKSLPSWQKLLIAGCLYLSFFGAVILVYLTIL